MTTLQQLQGDNESLSSIVEEDIVMIDCRILHDILSYVCIRSMQNWIASLVFITEVSKK